MRMLIMEVLLIWGKIMKVMKNIYWYFEKLSAAQEKIAQREGTKEKVVKRGESITWTIVEEYGSDCEVKEKDCWVIGRKAGMFNWYKD